MSGFMRAPLALDGARAVSDDKTRPILSFIGSTDNPVRNGSILRQDWQLQNYKKNPVFLYGHDSHGLPIGRAMKVYKDTEGEAKGSLVKGERLLFDIAFVPREIYPHAFRVYQMYDADFLHAVSVGFMPGDWRDLSKEERKEYGIENPWAEYLMKPELYELSSVTVPMDPDALKLGVQLGFAQDLQDMERMAAMTTRQIISETQIEEAKAYFAEIERSAKYAEPTEPAEPQKEVINISSPSEEILRSLDAVVAAVKENTEAVRESAALRVLSPAPVAESEVADDVSVPTKPVQEFKDDSSNRLAEGLAKLCASVDAAFEVKD